MLVDGMFGMLAALWLLFAELQYCLMQVGLVDMHVHATSGACKDQPGCSPRPQHTLLIPETQDAGCDQPQQEFMPCRVQTPSRSPES